MASRYSSYITTTNASSFDSSKSDPTSSLAIIKSDKKSSMLSKNNTKTSNLSSIMKKLIVTKSNSSSLLKNRTPREVKTLNIQVDFVAEDLNKNGGFSNIHKKLLKGLKGKKEGGKESNTKERKALMEVKNQNGTTRNLAMVLRSERELLSANKEQEEEIVELQLLLEEKNMEVEKLKDLCLKQREEIKYLKNSILFPDDNAMDSHIKKLMETEGSELSQAKQLIPSLQRQVTSLTGQLQCLAEDLAEVKAEKIYHGKGSMSYEANEFSTPPGSPNDLFHKDLNPCLTPFTAKTKSEEFKVYDSNDDE